MKPISIQLYTVRSLIESQGLLPVLRQIAEIGYKGVEGGGGNGLTPEEFRTEVERLGMVVSSTWGDVGTVEGAEKLIENCRTLGTEYAAGGFWIPQFESIEAINETARKLNETLPRLKDAGLRFGLHNHWMEFELRDGKLAIDLLIEQCPEVGLELDVYWATNFGANRAEDMAARYRDRTVLMHVKDGSMVKDEPNTAVGKGTLDIPACVANTDAAWLIVELDHYAGDMMEAVRDSYAYLVGNGLAAGNR